MTIVESRRERKKIAARAQILSTAINLFSRRGLDAVTNEEIAAAADVGNVECDIEAGRSGEAQLLAIHGCFLRAPTR